MHSKLGIQSGGFIGEIETLRGRSDTQGWKRGMSEEGGEEQRGEDRQEALIDGP